MEHQLAFDSIKTYLSKALIMANVRPSEPLKSYIAASSNTIGCMLAQDDEDGHERAVYYLSRVLTDIETRGHLGKWMLALIEFDLQYVPAKAVKGQVIADFFVDNSKDLHDQGANIIDVEVNYWKLYFDGSKHKDGAGVRILVISPEVPLIEVSQSEIIDFVEEHIIHRFGISQTLSTDQGTMFTGQQIKNFATSRSINVVTSTPYYAQANGQVEAANKILISLIKKHIGNKSRTWHETLSQVLWTYRNLPRGSIGTSPYKLVYGHDAVLPLEINLNTLRVSKQNDLPVDDYWNAMFDELNELDSERILALDNVIRQKESVARSYNRRIKEKSFRIGELVLKVILPMEKKSRFLGKWSHS
ncbi:uncharacterized protein LOC107615844 [Arachis ipaensis]|uniref:uncharacterized protein LOC107615844 n=1 Tax=Arachis ipaensis TaxID=130454 RepID=UPI0007AF0BA4|nr:uncharacterized protein LOC107615844 [Arachis ipaensis]XP_025678785.1 uncharacterized protein LOC112778705 [Arachis hypogaea]